MKLKRLWHELKSVLLDKAPEEDNLASAVELIAFIETEYHEYTRAKIVYAIAELTKQRSEYDLTVMRVIGLRQSYWMLRKPRILYAPLFDQRILTEKLLGKPSPGLPPPAVYAAI